MNRTIFVIVLFLLSCLIYAREVPGTNEGIANASPGDYIMRSNGEKVILRQADIIFAKKQLGLSTQNNSSNKVVSNNNNNMSTGDNANRNLTILIVFICIAHIILTYCVYKTKGGYFACFYFFLAPLALLTLVVGLEALSKAGKSREDIHHHFH